MNNDLQAQSPVAILVARMVKQSRYTQKEIAKMCGFKTPNIISMIKQGITKVPIEKIPALAKALGVDRAEFFTLVMKTYNPNEYEVIVQTFGEPITDAERKIVKLLRDTLLEDQLTNNTDYYRKKIQQALSA